MAIFGCVCLFIHGLQKRSFLWVTTSFLLCGLTCLVVEFIAARLETVAIPSTSGASAVTVP
jgi:hypothetical protein